MSREGDDTRRHVQAIRPVYNTGKPTTPAAVTDPDVVFVAVHSGNAGEEIFYWEDIVFAFKDALNIRHGTDILSFVRGSNRKRFEPLCFAAMPDVVLDVYVEAPLMLKDHITAAIRALYVAPTGGPQSNMRASNSALRAVPHSTFQLAPRPALKPTLQLAPKSRLHPKDQPAPKPLPQTASQAASQIIQTASQSTLQSPPPSPLPSASEPGKTSPPPHFSEATAQPKKSLNLAERPQSSTKKKNPTSSLYNLKPATQPIPNLLTTHFHSTDATSSQGKTKTDTNILRAKAGDVDAQVMLAEAYRDGSNGYQQSYLEAKDWFLRAANQENATAQYNIGLFYELAQGVEKNSSTAAFWYDKAAHQGFAKAQSNLGILYVKGDGVEKNNALAMQWLVKAANQGNASAQFNLGRMYHSGEGVPANRSKAMEWLFKAAQKGHVPAREAYRELQAD